MQLYIYIVFFFSLSVAWPGHCHDRNIKWVHQKTYVLNTNLLGCCKIAKLLQNLKKFNLALCFSIQYTVKYKAPRKTEWNKMQCISRTIKAQVTQSLEWNCQSYNLRRATHLFSQKNDKTLTLFSLSITHICKHTGMSLLCNLMKWILKYFITQEK